MTLVRCKFTLFLLLAISSVGVQALRGQVGDDGVTNAVLVTTEYQRRPTVSASIASALDSWAAAYDGWFIEADEMGRLYQFDTAADADNFIDLLDSLTAVDPSALGSTTFRQIVTMADREVEGALFTVPNDPLFAAAQWNLPIVHATEAWDKLPVGAPLRTIAVIDTGVRDTHPDLTPQVVAGGADVTDPNGTTDDASFHGTHVAGIAAAVSNNNYGIAGFSPNARILPVKVQNASDKITTKAVAKGIKHARLNGAQVINISLGFNKSTGKLDDEIDKAAKADIVIVASAGNDNQSSVKHPAAHKEVISVGASNEFDGKWIDDPQTGTNFGPKVMVAAPGANIQSTSVLWAVTPATTDDFFPLSGTSMAAPHVSALAALLRGIQPAASRKKIRTWIQNGADPAVTWTKFGRIDALQSATLAEQWIGPGFALPSTAPIGVSAAAEFTAQWADQNAVPLIFPDDDTYALALMTANDTQKLVATSVTKNNKQQQTVGLNFTNSVLPLSGQSYTQIALNLSIRLLDRGNFPN